MSLALFAASCGGSKTEDTASGQIQQEVDRLREENLQLPQLRAENQEVQKLRAENQDIHKLRGQYQELARLRKENDQLRNQLTRLPIAKAPVAGFDQPAQPSPSAPTPRLNLLQAFEEASLAVEGQEIKEQDKPQEGDRILIDTNGIALLIPDLKATNAGPYEISGWLKSRGVRLKNYQQFNSLGITNYHIQRADPDPQRPK